ncbi:hypothetical protein INS49_004369 [Diaporthe citri]|uniref:uncharacterized protein n=1 Tax=Diaporthe citri TaxID=83186 RepID=UPI001C814B51|nr:uncharacterized protein INS49_004369 [Diaporthe citri]KAG6354352.1 hypothetical protein INS49_004369 [Diaporthe citri]
MAGDGVSDPLTSARKIRKTFRSDPLRWLLNPFRRVSFVAAEDLVFTYSVEFRGA